MLPTYETKILEHISPPSWAPIAHFLQSCPLLDLFRIEIAYYKSVGPAADERGWVAHFYNELRDALPTHFVDEKLKVEVVVERLSSEWMGPDFAEVADEIA
ncbi:hypothetical protein PHLGIDRAFT_19376 [Phlebiopsis gigantea 11061_1 CR5-6]|uniref:Uncharacterized protein n=1 Tax=Phlebiopsis gigantea (strain 11061_1 CR5-6) TaxID=745531 RepID=A0A0C3S7H6_PHLG1|nr:hypothetical protein PHLGIDRAFT_19376 [Phlebiopsis gigantea 11061_1 CR5-6]